MSKIKFTAKIATGKIDAMDECFSEEALNQLRDSVIGSPLSVAFIHKLPGQIDTSELNKETGELFVSGTIEKFDPSLLGDVGKLYAVPGFIKDGDNYKMVEVGITHHPADENLTPIEFTND